jgi:VWFA-related protein
MQAPSFLSMVAVISLVTSLQAFGKPRQTSPTPSPQYRSITRAVAVDIVVEKGDDPISGLPKQDFQVLEDGKPQVIDFFEEHTGAPMGSALSLPKMPAGVYTNLPAVPEHDSVNVLLLDALNTDEQDQVYVHNEIVEFLKKMQPGTRAAIFTLGSKLRMVQGFTTDSAALHAALNDPKYGVAPEKPYESRSLSDKMADIKHIDDAMLLSPGMAEAVQSFQRDFASYQGSQRVSMTLDALQALARFLDGVPGRKNLIWFSSSFPVTMIPQPDQSQHANRPNTDDLREFGTRMRQTANLLNSSKIAVYPVSAEGVMSEHGGAAETMHPTDQEGQTDSAGQTDTNGLPSGRQTACMECYLHESGARAEKIMSMERLAEETGGRAFFNTNGLAGAAQKAIADGAHYYTLIYTPTNQKSDGSYRKIKVKLSDSKYRLEYRRGYYADDASAGAADKPDETPLKGLMAYGMPDATQILFAARVLSASPQPSQGSPRAGRNTNLTGSTTRFSVNFMIRSTDVKLDSAPDGTHRGKLQIEMHAYDRAGDSVNWLGGTWALNIKPDSFAKIQKSGLLAHFDIDLPTHEDIYLETGVYDWETGRAGTLTIPLLKKASTSAIR